MSAQVFFIVVNKVHVPFINYTVGLKVVGKLPSWCPHHYSLFFGRTPGGNLLGSRLPRHLAMA